MRARQQPASQGGLPPVSPSSASSAAMRASRSASSRARASRRFWPLLGLCSAGGNSRAQADG